MSDPRSAKPIKRQCTAMLSDRSRRCRLSAIRGSTVCHKHGGGAPQVKSTARDRLLSLAEPAVVALEKAVRRVETNDNLALHPSILRACQLILDRAGFPPRTEVEIRERAVMEAEAEGKVIAAVICRVLTAVGVDVSDSKIKAEVRTALLRESGKRVTGPKGC